MLHNFESNLPWAVALVIVILSVVMWWKRSLLKPKHNCGKPSHTFSSNEPEVIIIGSGVLGSAMGAVLARDGRQVTIIERDLKEPDRIVGELLQPGGLEALKKLGLESCVEGFDAQMMEGYVVHYRETGAMIDLPYPKDSNNLVFQGCAFHHGKFIMALREAAKREKNVTYIEGTASKLIEDNGVVVGVKYKEKHSETLKEIFAPLTIVADGCFSKFRKDMVGETVTVTSHFVGTLMKNCPQSKDKHLEFIMTNQNPVLVYQISSDETRLLVDIKGQMPKDLKGYLLDKIAPQLPDHMKEPYTEAVTHGQIRSMPNSFLPAFPLERPGSLILGDALNMRHPLTGGGMTAVFNDTIILRDLMKSVTDLSDYDKMRKITQEFLWKRKNNHSFVINILANALYEVFSASEGSMYLMKKACFAYFQLGGKCAAAPMELLSAIKPKPLTLIQHFVGVALYAGFFGIKREPWWAIHRMLLVPFMVLFNASNVILPLIWRECKQIIA